MTKLQIEPLDRMPERIANSPDLAEIWKECLPTFDRARIGKLSQELAIGYCWAIWLCNEASDDLDKEGLSIRGPRGKLSVNPSFRALNTAMTRMLDFANRLGLTPQKLRKTLAEFGNEEVDEPDDGEGREETLLDFVKPRSKAIRQGSK